MLLALTLCVALMSSALHRLSMVAGAGQAIAQTVKSDDAASLTMMTACHEAASLESGKTGDDSAPVPHHPAKSPAGGFCCVACTGTLASPIIAPSSGRVAVFSAYAIWHGAKPPTYRPSLDPGIPIALS